VWLITVLTYLSGGNISCFQFPENANLQAVWVKKVLSTRADFKGPTKSSVLCSEHFTKDCFEKDTEISASFGMKKRRRLVKGAIPKIF